MASFADLLVERRLYISQFTRIVPNYRKLGKEKITASRTRTRIESLQELWRKCVALDVQLHLKREGAQLEDKYFKDNEFLVAKASYEESLDQLRDLLSRQEHVPGGSATQNPSQSMLVGEGQGPSSFASPRITIPKFNGNTTKWESFRDTFTALVGNTASLTPAQKLYYLKSFLSDSASLLIEYVTISDANYDGAWKILSDEYKNLRALVFAQIHAFANLPVMKTENAVDLKRLRDAVNSSITALKNLGQPIDSWDDLLVFIVSKKFCEQTRIEWNLRLGASNEIPSFNKLKEFMTERIRGITPLGQNEDSKSSLSTSKGNKGKEKVNIHTTTARQCSCCAKNHLLAFCPAWRNKTIDERYEIAKSAKLCFNCLRPGHFPSSCASEKRCIKCKRAHHTFLHRDASTVPESTAPPAEEHDTSAPSTTVETAAFSLHTELTKISRGGSTSPKKSETQSIVTTQVTKTPSEVLLATAWVRLRTQEGRVIKARALLDQGSSHTFITESLAQQLHTKRIRVNLGVNVFGSSYTGRSTSLVNLQLESCNGNGSRLPMVAYVYQKTTSYAASKARYFGDWPHLQGLELADPDPHSSEQINLLIGADLYGQLLVGPLKRGPLGSPTAQLTTLGWIISGPIRTSHRATTASESVLHCVAVSDIEQTLRKFWEIEEIPTKTFLTTNEQECEDHFVNTHMRDSQGRYVVRLPFRDGMAPEIGESHQIALKMYASTERRLSKNEELAKAYNESLSEYELMGHMEPANEDDVGFKTLYLPHHPIIREDSATTRLRVVFDASNTTSNGTSLNDHLLTGQKLQQDIASVLLRWRPHRFVYVADIEKMFRQIWIHPEDADFQRIVWKPEKQGDVRSYRLLTVTYGTMSAPYLANRVLLQLASDEGAPTPRTVEVIRHSTYVDDVLFGAEEIVQARAIREELNAMLQRGGFKLRKWAANDPELLT